LGRPLDGSSVISESALPPASPPVGILPIIPPEELLPKFEAELTKVAGIPHRAASRQGLEEILLTILSHAKATSVVLSRNPLLAELNLESLLRARGQSISIWQASGEYKNEKLVRPYRTSGGGDSPEAGDASLRVFAEACFAATVGITGVEFALAETGSLVVTSLTEGAQLTSLAPPVHVALYRRNQLLASLDEVLERLPVASHPDLALPGRSVVFITGTSRTADIEQILIRGVHGPGELHAILVEAACFS